MLSFSAPTWQPTQKVELTRATKENRKPVASPIIPGRLFLTDFLTAVDSSTLERLNVTHILSILEFPPTFSEGSKRPLKTLHINIGDTIKDDILSRLQETTEWITQALAEEGSVVLVHCMMGVSRSATVVTAYLMASQRLSAADALARVRAARGIVRPNPAFARQLEAYGTIINVQPSTVSVGPKPSSAVYRLLRGIRAFQAKSEGSPGKPSNAVTTTKTISRTLHVSAQVTDTSKEDKDKNVDEG